MRQILLPLLLLLQTAATAFAQTSDGEYIPTEEEMEIIMQLQADSIVGQSGSVALPAAHCTLNVPAGFVLLDKDASRHLLVDYWNNDEAKINGVLGTMVKANAGIFYNVETAYVVSYDEAGYVADDDAAEIDYDALLKDMQDAYKEEFKDAPASQKWELLGWGWQPSYDRNNKVLAWAKHFRVDDHEFLNYDVRVLGKAGFIIITAVASPESKDQLMADNAAIAGSVSYDDGYRYADFNPSTDHVAEWTIGGLIAGKVLAKVGFWAVLAKFGKLIILGVIAVFAAMGKWFAGLFRRRRDDDDNDELAKA